MFFLGRKFEHGVYEILNQKHFKTF